ncbi:MAG: arsenite methyltransferase [Candidatus Brocadiia bacterium]|nr:arsenite methyltransferase [Candidatus Brocadiia bacterium]
MSTDEEKVHEMVRRAYGQVAEEQSCCCAGPDKVCCGPRAEAAGQLVPEAELGLSCGNPIGFSEIKPGDVVLDLGSGGGKDVFMAAKLTGPAGKAIGVDMTPEMLNLATDNAAKFREATGLDNVEFRQGTIEKLPLEDDSVDLVISNCVINLSPDKPRVFREVFRVLRPGGRMVVSDIVLNRPLSEELKSCETLYVSCVAGALPREDYLSAIRSAGFPEVEVLADQLYSTDRCNSDPIMAEVGDELDGAASSVTLLAAKPSA